MGRHGRLQGRTTRSTWLPIASSTGIPPKAMHRGSALSIQPRLQPYLGTSCRLPV
jgi:hypothetical protein